MRTQECITAAPGDAACYIKKLTAEIIAGNNLLVRFIPSGKYADRMWAFFVDGIWHSNVYATVNDEIEGCFSLNPGGDDGSVEIVEVGEWADFDDFIPYGWIVEEEESTARRLRIEWQNNYNVLAPIGDSQIVGMTVTGAKRFSNCEADPNNISRAWLQYAITSVGSNHTISIFANNQIVAEGSIIGDGAFTCSAIADSGLTVTGTLTYTADILLGTAKVCLDYPGSYKLHISKSSLVYPRTAEATISERGVDNYIYLSSLLAGDSYNYSVQSVSNEGVELNPVPTPTDSPKIITTLPIAPTITSVTGNVFTGVTINWTQNDSGCYYTIYSSKANEPVNFRQWAYPIPYDTAEGATTTTLVPYGLFTKTNNTTRWNSLCTVFDAQMTALKAGWTAAIQATYPDAIQTIYDTLRAEIIDYSNDVDINPARFLEQLYYDLINYKNAATALVSSGLTTANWQSNLSDLMADVISNMGNMLASNPWRYTLPDGTYAATDNAPVNEKSIQTFTGKLIKYATLSISLRATKAGVQEHGDQVWMVEIDDAGNVIQPRPNQAWVESWTSSGLDITAVINYAIDNEMATPDLLRLFVVDSTTDINWDIPQATGAPSDFGFGLMTATVTFTVATSGYYKIGAGAYVTSTGARSEDGVYETIYVTDSQPAAPVDVHATVIRGEDIQP